MIRLSEAGHRSNEPGNLGPPEQPGLLRLALELLEEHVGWGLNELASAVRLPRPWFARSVASTSRSELAMT